MSAYDPKEIEKKWYPFWEKNGFFKANASSSKPSYTISIPPPNITGVLHMGHALVNTLQDILIRWKRMEGFEALWVPGTDHAGIATQTVVERSQMAKTGKRRKDYTREDFLDLIWQWKETHQNQIIDQIKRLGCSCDWDRLAFTMDKERSKAVYHMFKKMFDQGLIYQGDYLVNWDPITQTALADDEVEHEERNSNLWHFRYPLVETTGYLVVATTRPETMLGDTAVAVNPRDPRYTSLVGQQVLLPFTDRKIPIIADDYVEAGFGSGVVKITPAHDPNDYEMAMRHHLPMINIMTPDGKINENGVEFANLSMEEARFAIVKKMENLGFLEKVEPYRHRVGISYRSKAIIEPYLSKQWFVKMSSFKEPLISAVKEGRVKLIPKDFENVYFQWIENLRDWCISRQLWWGHRIPIWYKKKNPSEMICFAEEGLPPEVESHPEEWVQDEDVLDTWFSSALWPFSVLGWPDQTPDLKKFYPNSVLVTGHDILFFWVARMLLMGEYGLHTLPFKETFLHGLIYGKSYWRYHKDGTIAYLDAKQKLPYELGESIPPDVHTKWEKMSKTKGNVTDPLAIIDEYGTDALRMTLCSITTHSHQIDLDRRRFEEYKNFINKIWNAAHFVLHHLESATTLACDPSCFLLEDRWILSRLNKTIQKAHSYLETYTFDKLAQDLYHFFWDEFCAYYLELSKPTLFGKIHTEKEKNNKLAILLIMLSNLLRLFHPIIPYITEELFTELKALCAHKISSQNPYLVEVAEAFEANACIVAPYPTLIAKEDIQEDVEEQFRFMDRVLHAIRTIRAEMQLAPNIATELLIQADQEDPHLLLVEKHQEFLKAFIRFETIKFGVKDLPSSFYAANRVDSLNFIIPLPEEMKTKEKQRLQKLQTKLIQQEQQLRAKLANEEFTKKAPKELVEKFTQNVVQLEQELAEIGKKLQLL